MPGGRTYIAIDLKSFYASVECVERGLDPLAVNLVVADEERTDKTICLAVSPTLKAYGIGSRPRLFQVEERVRAINARRRQLAGRLQGSSAVAAQLEEDPSLALAYLVARPRMALYIDYSSRVFQVYLRYVAPEDIHAYSIDEVFIDATAYLPLYGLDAHGFAQLLLGQVLAECGLTATCGIGSNLYLCKVAMDIVAKKLPPDEQGARIASLDEAAYRRQLWGHQPLTDFWRIGPGTARRLAAQGLYSMGAVARCSLGSPQAYYNEDLLYGLFGVNAELLIDHAWGFEPCTLAQVKAYQPASSSHSTGQLLPRPYSPQAARLVVAEMAEGLALELAAKGLVTEQLALYLGYDGHSLLEAGRRFGPGSYGAGAGRLPSRAHASCRLPLWTASGSLFRQHFTALYDGLVEPRLQVRRLVLTACRVSRPQDGPGLQPCQMDLFAPQERREAREAALQQTVLALQRRFGKNALLRGMNLLPGATTVERNGQIGGHRA